MDRGIVALLEPNPERDDSGELQRWRSGFSTLGLGEVVHLGPQELAGHGILNIFTLLESLYVSRGRLPKLQLLHSLAMALRPILARIH